MCVRPPWGTGLITCHLSQPIEQRWEHPERENYSRWSERNAVHRVTGNAEWLVSSHAHFSLSVRTTTTTTIEEGENPAKKREFEPWKRRIPLSCSQSPDPCLPASRTFCLDKNFFLSPHSLALDFNFKNRIGISSRTCYVEACEKDLGYVKSLENSMSIMTRFGLPVSSNADSCQLLLPPHKFHCSHKT